MGSCFSSSKVNGSNSNTTSNTTATTTTAGTATLTSKNHKKEPAKSVAKTAKSDGSHQKQNKTEGPPKQRSTVPMVKLRERTGSRRQSSVPCGKRTDFGYEKDFDQKYTIGKLLGHGQFGYTYVATDKSNSDRVAVKKIDKSKVLFSFFFYLGFHFFKLI